MTKFYKRLFSLLFFVVAISVGVIYFTVDINTVANLTMFQPWAIGLAFLSLAIGLLFDGLRLVHMVGISHGKITLKQTMPVVFGNYFLALITPGATGGALAQLLFLRRAGVTTGMATVFVIVRTLMSILFLLCCLPIIFYHDTSLLSWLSQQTLISILVCLLGLTLTIMWAVRTPWPRRLLKRFGFRIRRSRRHMLFQVYRDVHSAILLLRSAPKMVFVIFIESGISLLALYGVVPALFLGMDANFDLGSVIGRMVLLNLLLYFAPTPGGSGIAEGGFVLLFNEFLPKGMVGIVAVAWRFIVEYIPFFIGFYFTIKAFGEDFVNAKQKAQAAKKHS
ncbi:MAG: flippase-like domain-containing protein [Selenomonadales bacterium]|nr:flippase-like domain-containing protein [Selenomonadales bacterium]